MVLTETTTCNFGEKAVDFKLIGTDDKIWSLADCAGDNGTLVMFICNHCPYVKAIQSELVEDTLKLMEVGVKSVAIMSNDPQDYPEDSFENMKKISSSYDFPFPYLFDETQEIAKAYNAVCTPDFFGYNDSLKLQYRGRFDASGMAPATQNTKHDLLEAMQQVAETSKGPREQIPSMGCSIKWKI
jgi:peroxiredoxin